MTKLSRFRRVLLTATFALAGTGWMVFSSSLERPATAAAVQEQPAVESANLETAKRLLELTDAANMAKAGMEQQLVAMEQAGADVPPGFFEAFRAEIDLNLMVDGIAEVYAHNLSEEEMQAAIKFYESPEGKSFTQKQGKIMEESARVGERLGMEWATRAMQKIEQ